MKQDSVLSHVWTISWKAKWLQEIIRIQNGYSYISIYEFNQQELK